MSLTLVPDVTYVTFSADPGSANAGPSLSFEVGLSANFSQTLSLSLLYWAVNNEQSWIVLSRSSSTAPFTARIQLPEFAKSGSYEIRLINVQDNNGTQLSLNRDQLQAMGHTVVTALTNPNADEVPPELIAFSAGEPFWHSDGSPHVGLTLTAADSGSGLKQAFIVELVSPTGVSLQQWATFNSNGTAQVDFQLPRFAPTGSYAVNTVRLTDEAGNYSLSQSWLQQNPRAVQLVNPAGDEIAPAMSTFTLRAVYDPQTHRPKIVIKGSAQDALSGLSGAYARFVSPDGLVLDAPWMPITPLGLGRYAFEYYKALSTEFMPGSYQVQYLFVQDAAGNRTTLDSQQLSQGQLQSFVRVYFPTSNSQTRIQGSGQADFVFGTDLASETLEGGGGGDYLYGGAGDDRVDAGDGDDEIVGGDGGGNDEYLGGPGTDTVRYTSAISGISVDLEAGVAKGSEIGNDSLSEVENIIGGQAGDMLKGDGLANEIDGYTGDDFINGGAGDDTLIGGAGVDTLDGAAGDDQLLGGLGDDVYLADAQGDLVFESAGEGTDIVRSSASYYLYAQIENLTLTDTAYFGVGNELDNILTGNARENLLIGGAGADTVRGGDARDALFGVDGNDALYGDAGIDYVVAGLGNDTIDGGADADEVYGQEGDDAIHGGEDFATDILVGGEGNDTIDGGLAWDLMYGGPGDDTFVASQQVDWAFEEAGEGTDTVIADSPNGYYLYANVENLTLIGATPFGVGNELGNRITGNAIGNVLLGGAGNDLLDGGPDQDLLWGQDGADTFRFSKGTGLDIVADFTPGTDRLDVSAYGWSTLEQVKARMVQVGGDIAFDLGGGDSVILIGVSLASLGAADVVLGPQGG